MVLENGIELTVMLWLLRTLLVIRTWTVNIRFGRFAKDNR
jgi:hypothetical protein